MKNSLIIGALVTLMLLFAAPSARADDFVNPPIISGAKMIEKGRYSCPSNYNETLMNYRRMLRNSGGGFKWRTIIHQNNLKAKYLENTRKNSKWAGINIYEYNGETRIFVVPR